MTRLRTLEAGEFVFSEGEPGDAFFLLLSGRVRLVKVSAEGQELTLHFVGPGHLFAEAAVLGGSVYPATAVAVEPSRIAVVTRDPFVELLRKRPAMALKIISSLSIRVLDFAQKLEDRSMKEVPARVAGFLLGEHRRRGEATFTLKRTKTEVAVQLGMSRESFSRGLRGLRERGIIAMDGKRFTVLDPAALIEAAG
jgi:CRP/FNR family transcriptional regulator